MINGGISREWPHLTIRAVKGVERILSLKFDPVEKMGERSILIVSVAIEGLVVVAVFHSEISDPLSSLMTPANATVAACEGMADPTNRTGRIKMLFSYITWQAKKLIGGWQ